MARKTPIEVFEKLSTCHSGHRSISLSEVKKIWRLAYQQGRYDKGKEDEYIAIKHCDDFIKRNIACNSNLDFCYACSIAQDIRNKGILR